MAKSKNTHKFKVTLKAPAQQRQADAIQWKHCYTGNWTIYNSLGNVKEFIFMFEGPEKKIKASHSMLKKLTSRNIHVGAIKKT